jgi:hypothetical protein
MASGGVVLARVGALFARVGGLAATLGGVLATRGEVAARGGETAATRGGVRDFAGGEHFSLAPGSARVALRDPGPLFSAGRVPATSPRDFHRPSRERWNPGDVSPLS